MKITGKAHKVGSYAVIFEKTGTGYSAYVPDLPGCIAAGDTILQTTKLVRKAIEMHVAGMREDGLTIPEPATTVEDMPRTLSLSRSWGGHRAHRAAARRRMRRTPRKRRS
jgi:predicted RNase H-like HicB family nuclease